MTTAIQAFSKQAQQFDRLNDMNCINSYCRNLIYKTAEKFLVKNDSILELNCGTGIDAIYFSKNHSVTATDGALGMVNILRDKIKEEAISNIEVRQLPFENLYQIKDKKYDFIFSNFGGLNCTSQLNNVLKQLPALLNENGKIMLVIMPPVSIWEHLHIFSLNFKVAFRRWRKDGAAASVENVTFKSYYYSAKYIIKNLQPEMNILHMQGLCNIMPPEFMHHYLTNKPKLRKWLGRADSFLGGYFPFTQIGDYSIIVMRKKTCNEHQL